jgi:hypothetical protein
MITGARLLTTPEISAGPDGSSGARYRWMPKVSIPGQPGIVQQRSKTRADQRVGGRMPQRPHDPRDRRFVPRSSTRIPGVMPAARSNSAVAGAMLTACASSRAISAAEDSSAYCCGATDTTPVTPELAR